MVVKTCTRLINVFQALVCRSGAQIAPFLFGVDVPNHVIGQANDLISGPLRHLCEAFCFRLVFESVTREIDA